MEKPKGNGVVLSVELDFEDGCNVKEGEYGWGICSIVQGSVDDLTFDLVKECVHDHVANMDAPNEGFVTVLLVEDGEWEDVFWSRYFVVAGELNRHEQ